MAAYYNEIDPYAAQWLRNLIQAGHIAPGDVDERSIVDVQPDDLRGYSQCHFFAGIGGWSYALRLSGWPDDRHVWTGSCPCQPLSVAGQRQGHADSRHLWPAFYALIAERAPAIVFGEQVASADGREWFAGIRADLEVLGYACGAADLCAAGVSSPHIRQRIYWLAHADGGYASPEGLQSSGEYRQLAQDSSIVEGPRHTFGNGLERPSHSEEAWQALSAPWASSVAVICNGGERKRIPAEPGLFPLVDGVSARMDKVRGAGNAIVPQVAAEFIRASVN